MKEKLEEGISTAVPCCVINAKTLLKKNYFKIFPMGLCRFLKVFFFFLHVIECRP